MTREEAIKAWDEWRKNGYSHSAMPNSMALVMAYNALRGPTREQMEKVWGGEWIGSADGYADGELVYDIWECSECGYVIDEEDDPDMLPKFCPKCYAAMTDEAVEITLRRLEALHENNR